MKDAINYHLSQGPIYGTKWHSRFEKNCLFQKTYMSKYLSF